MRGYTYKQERGLKLDLLEAVDGKHVDMRWKAPSSVKVSPGRHTIKFYAYRKRNMLAKAIYRNFDLTLNALPNGQYHIKTALQGTSLSAWIIDQQGRTVSKAQTKELIPGEEVHVTPMSR